MVPSYGLAVLLLVCIVLPLSWPVHPATETSMPEGNAPVNYLEENTWQHVGASGRARSIRPTLSPVLSGTNERAIPAERPR